MTTKNQHFERLALPHLNACYNLARWLLKDEHSAQDAVQEAYLRAFRFFESFNGGEIRPWLLGIVRNVCFSYLRHEQHHAHHEEFDEDYHSASQESASELSSTPEALLVLKVDRQRLNTAIEHLPTSYRETLILRELEELAYEDIAHIVGVPIGTVMSRLSRARHLLRAALVREKT